MTLSFLPAYRSTHSSIVHTEMLNSLFHRIDTAVEPVHATGQIAIRRLNDQMIVIGHLAGSVAAPIGPITRLAQPFQPNEAVFIIEVNRLAPVCARGDMVQPTGQLDSKRSYMSKCLACGCWIASPDPTLPSAVSRPATISASFMTPNDQLTDGGPPLTFVPSKRSARSPFGGAPGSTAALRRPDSGHV